MPYIHKERRALVRAGGALAMSDLAYAISCEIRCFIANHPVERRTFDHCYGQVLGALESVKASYLNDVLNPYEEKAKERNGPVF